MREGESHSTGFGDAVINTDAAGTDASASVVPSVRTTPAHGRMPRDYPLRRLLAAGDALAIVTALAIAEAGFGVAEAEDFLFVLLSLPVWIFVFKLYGLYDRDAKRVSHSTVDDIPWLLHALAAGTLALWLVFRLAGIDGLTYREITAFYGIALISAFVDRAVVRYAARRMLPPERVVFVGGGPMAALLVKKIRLHPEYGLEPLGYVDRTSHGHPGLELPYLGANSELERICLSSDADRVVVVSSELEPDLVLEAVRMTKGLDLRVSVVPRTAEVLGPSVEIDDVEGITVLGINPPALTRSSRLLKRALDVAVASLALLMTFPLLAVIALVVKLTSPGPVFYVQERVGRGGRRFRMIKFRTMAADAESRAADLREQSAHPIWLLLDRDPRVTPVGATLRHFSLDELPQLLNVLRGDMSLVGPRPMPPEVDEQIRGWGRRRLDLTPGITGLWQVLGRTAISFEEMVKLDYLYVTNWSLWQDVRLLIRTLPAVLSRRGAN